MGIKSKVLGLFAAVAMTFSVGAIGVGAVPGTAVLLPNQCEAGPAFNTAAADFGTWKYNGSSGYGLEGTLGVDNAHTLNVNIAKVAAPGGKCTVGIDITSELTNGTDTISNAYFSGETPSQEVVLPISAQQALGTVGYTLKLDSVPSTVSTGTYNGTVTVTVSAGQ